MTRCLARRLILLVPVLIGISVLTFSIMQIIPGDPVMIMLQGQTLEGMRDKFGAVLDAFEYGAPPHGGIALGIDRWAALLSRQTNIREVMAFPKTQSGSDPMLDAPSAPEPKQLEELGLRFVGAATKPAPGS